MPQVGPRMNDIRKRRWALSSAALGSQPWWPGGSGGTRLAAKRRGRSRVCGPQALLPGHRLQGAPPVQCLTRSGWHPACRQWRQTEEAHALRETGVIREETPVAPTAATCAQSNWSWCPDRRTPG